MTLSVHAWLTGAMVELLSDNEPSRRDGVWKEDCSIRIRDDKVTGLKILTKCYTNLPPGKYVLQGMAWRS